VCVWVCVCVWERERESMCVCMYQHRGAHQAALRYIQIISVSESVSEWLCVYRHRGAHDAWDGSQVYTYDTYVCLWVSMRTRFPLFKSQCDSLSDFLFFKVCARLFFWLIKPKKSRTNFDRAPHCKPFPPKRCCFRSEVHFTCLLSTRSSFTYSLISHFPLYLLILHLQFPFYCLISCWLLFGLKTSWT
jgi:hypothetical protein